MAKDKPKTAREVLAELRKEHNTENHMVIGSLGEFDMKIKGYSTGNLTIDFLTDVGGYPVGRIVEQFGEPSSGKTTSSLMALAVEQKKIIESDVDGYVMFLDYERSIDPEYCAALGLDVNHVSFLYVKPDSFEHGANLFRRMLVTGELHMAVFDSVAAMVSDKERAADTGKATVAERAKMLHQFCRQISSDVERYDCTPIFLNHTMEVVDSTPMGQKLAARGIKRFTQPGGKALPFYASTRIEFKKVGQVKTTDFQALSNADDETVSGQKVRMTVVKNKAGTPFGTAELRVRRGHGFSQPYSVLSVLTSHGVVGLNSTGWYEWPYDLLPDSRQASRKPGSTYKVRGEDTMLTALESDAQWLSRAEQRARSLLEQYGLPKIDGSHIDSNGVALEKDEEPITTPEYDEKPMPDADGKVSGTKIDWADFDPETGEVK